jgi:hypothetical protein
MDVTCESLGGLVMKSLTFSSSVSSNPDDPLNWLNELGREKAKAQVFDPFASSLDKIFRKLSMPSQHYLG